MGAPPPVAARIRARCAVPRAEPRPVRRRGRRRRIAGVSGGRGCDLRSRLPAHPEGARAPRAAGCRPPARSDAWVVSATARVSCSSSSAGLPAPSEDLAAGADGRLRERDPRRHRPRMGVAAVAPLRPLHIGADVRQVLTGDRELTLVLGTGTELRLGDSGDIRLKLSIAKQILPIANGASLPRRQRSRAARRRVQPSSRRLRLGFPCKFQLTSRARCPYPEPAQEGFRPQS